MRHPGTDPNVSADGAHQLQGDEKAHPFDAVHRKYIGKSNVGNLHLAHQLIEGSVLEKDDLQQNINNHHQQRPTNQGFGQTDAWPVYFFHDIRRRIPTRVGIGNVYQSNGKTGQYNFVTPRSVKI